MIFCFGLKASPAIVTIGFVFLMLSLFHTVVMLICGPLVAKVWSRGYLGSSLIHLLKIHRRQQEEHSAISGFFVPEKSCLVTEVTDLALDQWREHIKYHPVHCHIGKSLKQVHKSDVLKCDWCVFVCNTFSLFMSFILLLECYMNNLKFIVILEFLEFKSVTLK